MVTDVLGRYRNSEKDTLKLELPRRRHRLPLRLPKTNNANDTLELMQARRHHRHELRRL